MADHWQLTVVSIGYRLAPEDPWPAGAEDCYDAAEYLIKNGPKEFGGELFWPVSSHSTSSTRFPTLLSRDCYCISDAMTSPFFYPWFITTKLIL
jgi:hypothetical protein